MLPLQGTSGVASPELVVVVAQVLVALAATAVIARLLRGRRAND